MSLVIALMLGAAAPVRLPPVEQCSGDAAFDRFSRQLETAVAKRDLDRLTTLMAPDIRLSFGGAGGDGLWQNPLWDELGKVLRLGCGKSRDGAGIEYRSWPAMFVTGKDLDGYGTWVSLPGAIQRRQPANSAPIVQRLPSWTVLHEVDDVAGSYIEVRTPKGRKGFVAQGQLRSLIDYRLIAQRRSGRWMITAFLAGD